MKSFRRNRNRNRNRSTYLRAPSSSMDINGADDVGICGDRSYELRIIQSGQFQQQAQRQSSRRCGSLLVESIQKLNCTSNSSSTSKGVIMALMSQSEGSLYDRPPDNTVGTAVSNNVFLNDTVKSVDPLTIVYPSFNVYNGLTKNCTTNITDAILHSNNGRRREDDGCDDALAAPPRRFLPPTTLLQQQQQNTMTTHISSSCGDGGVRRNITSNVSKHTLIESSMTSNQVEYPEYTTKQQDVPYLCDIPECVVIPRRTNSFETDLFRNNHDVYDYDTNEDGSTFFKANGYDDIQIRSSYRSRSATSRGKYHDFSTEDYNDDTIVDDENYVIENRFGVVDINSYDDDQETQQVTWEDSSFNRTTTTSRSAKISEEMSKSKNITELDGNSNFIAEYALQQQKIEYEFLDDTINDKRNHCTARLHGGSDQQQQQTTSSTFLPSYNSNTSQDFSFTVSSCSEGAPSVQQRTFYLASPTDETTKVPSSLSKKLHSDAELQQKVLSFQTASDATSFAETTKSGATLSTSHSTSTGIISQRSSSRNINKKKTQELIRRFERHGVQLRATIYEKGANQGTP